MILEKVRRMMKRINIFLRMVVVFSLVRGGLGVWSAPRPVQGAVYNTIDVTTTEDELNDDDDCSLREAIEAANTDTDVDECKTGIGIDKIVLQAET
jgi:CSLREA domain-containing protein